MQIDYLIVGQGICGTMLTWFLEKEGKSFHVIDNSSPEAASMVSGGIINPVTGRRYAYIWMIDHVMPFAVHTYQELERTLGVDIIKERSIIDFFPSPQMRSTFIGKLEKNDTYLHSYPDQNRFNNILNYDFGCGEIRPAYVVFIKELLKEWRNRLIGDGRLTVAEFKPEELEVLDGGVRYQQIYASKIIFCDGIGSSENPWFNLLPFALNKGEALIIECEGINSDHILKRSMLLAPTSHPHQYWIGSSYEWDYTDNQPSEQFLQHTTAHLKAWLKPSFKILERMAALRPATIERRPFAGFHPNHPQVGILNGMGTKGSSLAPYFARKLVNNLLHQAPIQADVDIIRFARVLSK